MTARRAESELSSLHHGIQRCRKCALHESRTHAVPGEGPPDPRVMFIGEAPGTAEDEQGLPFVGRSGAFLDELLHAIDLRRQDVFITSSVKCRPPQNRDPRRLELDICRESWLDRQIELLDPRVIVLLGRAPLRQLFAVSTPLAGLHGGTRIYRGRVCLLTYHPAAGMRFPKVGRAMRRDFRRLREMLDEQPESA